jgi:polar amino acid transport system permease protein
MTSWDQRLFLEVLTSPLVAEAAFTTLWIAVAAQAIGVLIGLATGPMLMSAHRALRLVAWVYQWLFRGTPLLVQILFFYAVLPQLGLPLGLVATGLLALGLNEGARMAEIVRSGLLSVPNEQREAGEALGLSRLKTFLLIVLPQAARAMLPPLGNNFIYMVKATSLLSIISFSELLRVSQQLAQTTTRPLECYSAVAVWYLAIVTLLTLLLRLAERRLHGASVPSRDAVRVRATAPLLLQSGFAEAPAPREDETPMPVVLAARGLCKSFGATRVLDSVDLSVHRGEVVVVIGPSGSGKSTLLRCLNWLDPPDTGTVWLDGHLVGEREDATGGRYRLPERAIDRQRLQIGMVFQAFNLFAHLSALDNVALAPRKLQGVSRTSARAQAMRLLTRFGLADKAATLPHQLSGGQRQRVAIARALAVGPRVILFDEPTSALDPETVGEVLDAMRALADEGTTMIVVTHEVGFARQVADRVIVMNAGRIVEEGPAAQVLTTPSDRRTRDFLAAMTTA